MLICTYVYGIAIPASRINLITIMGDYKSFQNSFPYEILATIPKHVLLWAHEAEISNPFMARVQIQNFKIAVFHRE